MVYRQIVIALTLIASAAVGFSSATPARAHSSQSDPCRIGGEGFDTLAFEHLGRVLTDTGAGASSFAWLRDTLDITGVNISSVAVVQDTISCRRALNAWKAFYTALGAEQANEAGYVKGGLLLRLTANRYALAVAVFHPWTGVTFFVLDSNFVMVRNGLM